MMKRTNRKKESRGLPGGPHEQFTYVTGVFSQDMYHVPKAQSGIEQPILYVDSEDDERYKSYIDSLIPFNAMVKQYNIEGNARGKSDWEKKTELYSSIKNLDDWMNAAFGGNLMARDYDMGADDPTGYIEDEYKKLKRKYPNEPLRYDSEIERWTTKDLNYNKNYDEVGENITPESEFYNVPLNLKDAIKKGEVDKGDIELLKYYESLGIPNERIGYYNSPDVYSDKVKAIGNWMGKAWNPVYPEPKVQVNVKGKQPLEKLKFKEIPQPDYRIHDYMKMEGMDPSPENRDMWAKMLGIKDYIRTAEQNEELIKRLKEYKKNPIRAQYGGNISTEGYKRNSKDVNNPFNVIMGDPSGTPITMGGVDFAVKGVDNLGNEKIMYPGAEYHFPGSMVYETPFRRAQEGNGEKEVQQIYDFNGSKWKIKDGVYEQVSDDAPVTNAHTIDRSSAYAKNKSERLFRNITPQGYGDLKTNLERYKRYKGDLGRDKEDVLWQSAKDSPTGKPIYYNLPKRDDMFRLYLGLNQEHNSFTPQLDYKPSKAKNPDALYWKPNYWDDEMKQYLLDYSLNPIGLRDNKLVYDNKIFNERSDVFLPKLESLEAEGMDWSDPQTAEWVADNPLGDFTVTKGEDDHGKYISIYDKIDFNPFQTGDGSSTNAAGKALQLYMKSQGYDVDENTEAASLLGAGKPYEIYDRIYYDDKTGKIIKSPLINKQKGGSNIQTPLRGAQQGIEVPTKNQIANDPELMNWDNYNTPLTKKEQKEFKKWMKEANIHPWDRGAYDIQGYWKEQVKGKGFDSVDDDGHRPDTYKKPNHPTFSMQSKYADHPGVEAGFWDGPDYYAPSTHRNLYGLDYYDWMNSREPDRPEKLAGYMEKPIIVTPKQQGGSNIQTPLRRAQLGIEGASTYNIGYRPKYPLNASESTRVEPIAIPTTANLNSYADFMSSKRFHKDWMSSPMHMQMLKKSAPDNYLDILKTRLQNINNATIRDRFIEGDQYIPGSLFSGSPAGGYAQGLNYVNQSPLYKSIERRNMPHMRQYNEFFLDLPTHELSHIQDYKNSYLGKFKTLFGGDQYDYQFTNLPKSDVSFIRNLKIKDNKLTKESEEYYSDPTEVRARLNEIRHSAIRNKQWDPFNEKMTLKKLKWLNLDIMKPGGLDDLQQIYSDEQIIDLLNTVSQTDDDQIYNNENRTSYAQSGGEFQKLVNKYTTQGWSSLNPQEQQFYRETYQRGGSIPQYQRGVETEDERITREGNADWMRGWMEAQPIERRDSAWAQEGWREWESHMNLREIEEREAEIEREKNNSWGSKYPYNKIKEGYDWLKDKFPMPFQEGGDLPSYQIQGETDVERADRINLLQYNFDEREFDYIRNELESGRWNELSPKEQEFYRKNQPVMRPVQNKFGMEGMKIVQGSGDDLEWIPNIYKGVIPTINVTASRPDDVNPVINAMRTGRDNLQNEIGKAVEEGTPWGAMKRMYKHGPKHYYDATNVALRDAVTLNKVPHFGEWAKLLDVAEVAPVGGLVTQGLKAPIKSGTKAIAKQVKQIPSTIKGLPKELKNLDTKAGDYYFGKYARMRDIETNANKYLKEGLGIKKGSIKDNDLAIKYNHKNRDFQITVKGVGTEKDRITGYIKLGDKEWKKPPSFFGSIFGKKPTFSSQISKELDFPYSKASELEGTGLGAEVVAAMNKAIKDKAGTLYSSKSHFDDGITRYLQEYLKERVLPGENFTKSTQFFLDDLKKAVGNDYSKNAIRKFQELPENQWIIKSYIDKLRWQYKMAGGELGIETLTSDKEQEYQSGGSTSSLWETKTGLPWSEAKARGLSDGTYSSNVALRKKLLNDEINFPSTPVVNDIQPIITPQATPQVTPEVQEDVNFDHLTFDEAFGKAREMYGPNKIFKYKGHLKNTNRSGEPFEPSEEELTKWGMGTKKTKEKIKKVNEDIVSPYTVDDRLEIEDVFEPSREWEKEAMKRLQKEVESGEPGMHEKKTWEYQKKKVKGENTKSQADLIIDYQSKNSKGTYAIVDKTKGLLHIYKPGNKTPYTAAIDLGENKGDAQTVTKPKDLNNDGTITDADKRNNKFIPNWSAGNLTTGAGKYYISNILPNGVDGLPLFNMMNERQYENYKKTGDVQNVSTSFHTGYIKDNPTRVSHGCIRCNKASLDQLMKSMPVLSEVFILPEDKDNKFMIQDGKLIFKAGNKSKFYEHGNIMYKKEKDKKGNEHWYASDKNWKTKGNLTKQKVENKFNIDETGSLSGGLPEISVTPGQKYLDKGIGGKFKKIKNVGGIYDELNKNAINLGYNIYEDEKGIIRKGQGVNRSVNTLNYKPIDINLDKARFNENIYDPDPTGYSVVTLRNKTQQKVVNSFVESLKDNKRKVMKEMQISGDVYNDLVPIAFGIFGNETTFGQENTAGGNMARALNKGGRKAINWLFDADLNPSSKPDYKSAYETYGLTDDENSVGLTQLRWSEVKGEPALLKKLNKLGIKSNKDLMDPEKAALATIARLAFLINNRVGVDKNDLMNTLPGHWGGSSKDGKQTYINNVKKNSRYISVLQKQKGGEITALYKEYADGKNISSSARKAYDKLNRMYYTEAKQQDMSPTNYIMTHVIGSK